MKAVVYNKKYSPDKLVYSDIEIPVPKDNEILVKVYATSINALDYRSIKMGMIPKRKIFGADISGIIESVGKNIEKFKQGDEVIGDLSDSGLGGFAEYTVSPENALVLKPSGISFEEAAALPVAATTALRALRDKGNIQKGKNVLIVGSSGGVGTYAVQLAKYFGAKVTTVCSTNNIEQMHTLGADETIDYTKEDFSKRGISYDLILAINGNKSLNAYKRILNKNGIYVMVGGSMKQIIKSILFGRIMSLGSKKMLYLSAKSNSLDLEFIAKTVAEGKIKPLIEKQYPLEKTIEAMRFITTKHAQGKIVIKVN